MCIRDRREREKKREMPEALYTRPLQESEANDDLPAEVEGRSHWFREGMIAAMLFLREKKEEAEQESTEEIKKNKSINQEKTSPQVALKRASPQPVVEKPVPKAYFNKTGVFKKNIIRGRC